MTKLVMHRPFSERDLYDDLGTDPVRAKARQAGRLGEWGLVGLDAIQFRPQFAEQPGVEAGADLPSEHEVAAFEVPHEQCTETDSRPLRIGKAAHDEFLARLTLHLQPVRRTAVLVDRVATLRDDAFPALLARPLPRLVIVQGADSSKGSTKAQCLQQRSSFVERERHHIPSVDPQDVEHVIREAAVLVGLARGCRPPDAGGLAIENQFAVRQVRDGAGDGRMVLFQLVAGKQLDAGSFLEREQPDPVELAFENPFRGGEPLVGQRRRHGDDPLRERCGHEWIVFQVRAPREPRCLS
jgi:hypothetical protein